MKILLTYFLFFSFCFASELTIEVNPKEPVMGEPFNLTFRIKTNSSEDPDISFNPSGAEVVGRNNQGISIKTMYINGRLSTSRETVYNYELIASRLGTVRISDIQVDLGNEKLTHANLSITILREPKQSPDIFAMAVVDKTKAFVGEGITARYYIYYKTNVAAVEIKEFPKLNKFTKRFLQEMDQPERVNYEGEVYYRQLKYSARLFTDKEGRYVIDPIILRVQFQERGNHDPFGGFGLGLRMGRMATRNVSSKSIELQIEKLPAENVPPHFTGLVGKHHFDLQMPKTKFLVNEPIELKFIVSGSGNLENFDEPKIINDPALEEFETNSDLKIETDISATKTFSYTFLGRGKVESKAQILPFSYFNPETNQYVTVNVNLPSILVEGEGFSQASSASTPAPEPEVKSLDKILGGSKPQIAPKEILAPLFQYKKINAYTYKILNIVLIFILITIWLIYFFKAKSNVSTDELEVIFKKIKNDGLSYALVYEFLNVASLTFKGECITDLSSFLGKIEVTDKTKSYFKEIIQILEKKEFFEKKTGAPLKFDKDPFKEIMSLKKK